jgi:hypothetical protein
MRFADWREYQEVVSGILRGSMARPQKLCPARHQPAIRAARTVVSRPSERFAIGTERRNLKRKYRDTAHAARRPKSPNLPYADTQSAAIRAALREWFGYFAAGEKVFDVGDRNTAVWLVVEGGIVATRRMVSEENRYLRLAARANSAVR